MMKHAADMEFYNSVIRYLVEGWQECPAIEKELSKTALCDEVCP
jgi:hypothetical protein